ncbi:MAG TPA: hypothetical protein VGX25_31980 [Actinophytocola sp.]|uniref:hypothetical protein n=1 Tax=Actinophytocola sp. TaxID=1872138 RepID=UPI002DDD19DE|nr:hypothetical protein [Actinophytocola sp.]HEV2784031.1 hypothetical protein [Actinophytocola sp.]
MTLGRSGVPYITTWSAEESLPTTVIQRPGGGIAYLDETLVDRDENGVLWQRVPSRPGRGRPEFGKVHPLRQRRAMRRLLCGICGGVPDRTDEGVLWLVRDFRGDWPDWPDGMAATEPPVCLPCAHRSVGACPALRIGFVAVRVGQSTVAGVYGTVYQGGQPFPAPVDDAVVAFDDSAIRWVQAAQLVRELGDCTILRAMPERRDQLWQRDRPGVPNGVGDGTQAHPA